MVALPEEVADAICAVEVEHQSNVGKATVLEDPPEDRRGALVDVDLIGVEVPQKPAKFSRNGRHSAIVARRAAGPPAAVDIRCVMRDAGSVRTTLHIDDDVLQAAKEIAASRATTAGKVLSELARKALEPRSTSRVRNGVPLLRRRKKGSPRPTMALVNRLRDER